VEDPQSFQAEHINRLFNQFNIAAAGMLLLVLVLVIYVTTKFRRRQGDNSEGAPIEGNRRVETLMIGFPTLLLAWFFYRTLAVSAAVMPPVQASRQPDVIITGHQFWWEVSYPRPAGSQGLASPADYVITANEVHLPVGRTLLIELRSADVIHDWWVPQLGNKMDLIPGNKNYLWVTIRRPGDYIGACSEFCGQQHAWMRINVVAQQPQDFNRWLDSNARNANPPADGLARQGEVLFLTKTCAGCHRIRGTPANGAAGPDLTHIGNRTTILTGLLTTSEEDLASWIDHPQEIKQGAYMPNFMFSKDSIKAIAHYLEQLK
jgi:cytochrome c oxidase subunit 2